MEPPGPIGNVGDHAGAYQVWLCCSKCGHSCAHDPLDLVDRLGNITNWNLVRRAVCSQCGGRFPEFRLIPWTPHSRGKALRKK